MQAAVDRGLALVHHDVPQSVDAALFFAAPGFNAAEVVGTKAAGIGSKRSRRYIIKCVESDESDEVDGVDRTGQTR